MEIPLSELHPFKNHPFKVKDDEAMMETADSVRKYGVLVPAIARPDPDGGYELVAGHRRHRASELAEKETMPVIVRDLDDDAATIIMVDSNLQRESLLPSERAFAYRNACVHSDRENAVIEGNAAIRRAILGSSDLELIRLYSDVLVFRQRLHREIIDETYPRLHEMLRPLSQDDIDDAIRAWNGDIQSKHAVVRYMEKHGREKDTAAWLAQEYSGSDSKSLFVIRAGSPEGIELPWPKVQRRIAQLIKEDRFYTEAEQDRFDNIDPITIREALAERGIVNGELVDEEKLDNDPFIQHVMADVERTASNHEPEVYISKDDHSYQQGDVIDAATDTKGTVVL